MIFTEAINSIDGFRFMIGRLDLSSPLSRAMMYELPWLCSADRIEEVSDQTAKMTGFISAPENSGVAERLRVALGQVKDIRGTVSRLEQGAVLDDIELFELKAFAILSAGIDGLVSGMTAGGVAGERPDFTEMPSLDAVVDVLDPDDARIAHFHIYDSYDPRLADVRRSLKNSGPNETDDLRVEHDRLEDEIRARLSLMLAPFAGEIARALEVCARIDLTLAKARQAMTMGLARPQMDETVTRYEGLFNPPVADALARAGKKFKPVDIELGDGPTLLTGTNMGGKTVVLNGVALSQVLCQFGFWVPATRARVVPVEEVVVLAAENRPIGGLSSFASEMSRLASMTERVKAGQKILALVDEAARTTNPVEGRAIVAGIVDFLARYGVRSLLTTHYGGIDGGVQRLRVAGFSSVGEKERMTLENIEDYMDYSLVVDDGSNPPREALRIARMCGVDDQLLDTARAEMD